MSDGERPPPTVHVFTGPTLSAAEAQELVPGARVHAPVAHGDLLGLETAPGDVVVIIDGYYHQRAPVRHKEVLHLLERGVRVVGSASMGALRAAELAPLGMIGHGRVFEMYRDGEIDADDEVAVAHVASGSFEARNVPLVNVRHAAAQATAAGAISVEQGAAVVAAARALPYTDRSWRSVRRRLAELGDDGAVPALVAFLAEHPEAGDLKRRDAVSTLADLPRIVSAPHAGRLAGRWRNRHIYDWLAEHRGHDDGRGLVGVGETVRYRQVHRHDFPAAWRAFVIGEVARGPNGDADDHAGVARAVLERTGSLGRALAPDNPFLVPAERVELSEDEALVRTVVRSYVPPRGLHDVVARLTLPSPAGAHGGPDDDEEVIDAIREARAVNDRVIWRNGIRLVERLSPERLSRHLETLWDVRPGDRAALLARARDRGLPTVADAIAAVRPYFLRHDAASAPARGTRGA